MSESALPVVIDLTSEVAPFEQLRTQIARLVAEGELVAGAKLPTVRSLATDLGLAANTVARSYRELEADGVIVTDGRRGSFVRAGDHPNDVTGELSALAAQLARAARTAGLTAPETVRLVERAWRID